MPAKKLKEIAYTTYIGVSGVDRYVAAYMKKRFLKTDKYTVHEWTEILMDCKAIDRVPPALVVTTKKKIESGNADTSEN